MTRQKIAILFLSLMPIYAVPVLSMHFCIGQEHHHGNCDGDMSEGEEQKQERRREKTSHSTQLEKAEHLHCFEIEKEQNPTITPKIDFTPQQWAVLIAVFDLIPDASTYDIEGSYHPPPNKEPPAAVYRVRPPPYFLS